MLRFAVVGIDHGHTFDHVKGLLAAGAEFVGYVELAHHNGQSRAERWRVTRKNWLRRE